MRKVNKIKLAAVVAALLTLPLAGATAQESGQPGMPEDMAEMMKLAQPGEHHEHMAKLAGKWNSKGKLWMQPGAEPIVSEGTVEVTSILGGRWMKSDFAGDFMGLPFTGLGLDGYDNLSQKHIGVWIDSMGTMMMTFEGTCQDSGRVTTTRSEFVDPATGTAMTMKAVTTIIDDSSWKFDSYMSASDGQEFKSMEILYTR
jgi:hypothetical protein